MQTKYYCIKLILILICKIILHHLPTRSKMAQLYVLNDKCTIKANPTTSSSSSQWNSQPVLKANAVIGSGLRSQVCHEAEKGSPSIGRCPWGNMCAGVLVQQPGKAETVGRRSTLHNGGGNEMNLARLTNCHSVEGELTMSAERLMDTLRLSLEVTSSWMIHEVSRFDWFDFYHNRN